MPRLSASVAARRRARDRRHRAAGRLRPERPRPARAARAAGRPGEDRPRRPLPRRAQAARAVPTVPSVPAPPASRPAGAPKTGGTLIVARTAEVTDLDPQLASSLARQRITMLTYNNLVKLSTDLVIQPDLAETWKVSADGKQIDFTLRQGVLWHPPVSRELTASDVKYSYERLLRESPGKGDFAAIDGVEVLDKYNVRFVLNTANAGILALMADSRWGAIVNRETVEKHGEPAQRRGRAPARSSSKRGTSSRRRGSSGTRTTSRRRSRTSSTSVLRVVPDEASIVAGLRSGAIHHATLDDTRLVEQVKGAGRPPGPPHAAPRLRLLELQPGRRPVQQDRGDPGDQLRRGPRRVHQGRRLRLRRPDGALHPAAEAVAPAGRRAGSRTTRSISKGRRRCSPGPATPTASRRPS